MTVDSSSNDIESQPLMSHRRSKSSDGHQNHINSCCLACGKNTYDDGTARIMVTLQCSTPSNKHMVCMNCYKKIPFKTDRHNNTYKRCPECKQAVLNSFYTENPSNDLKEQRKSMIQMTRLITFMIFAFITVPLSVLATMYFTDDGRLIVLVGVSASLLWCYFILISLFSHRKIYKCVSDAVKIYFRLLFGCK